MTLLVQREVAQKACAKPGNLNVLAIDIQAFGKPKIISKVPPSHFKPAPKVNSAILNIEIDKPLVNDKDLEKLFTLVHKGFAHKRKKLAKNLGIDEEILEKLELNKNARAQELSLADWERLL